MIYSRVTGSWIQILVFLITIPGFKFVLNIWGIKCQDVSKIVLGLGLGIQSRVPFGVFFEQLGILFRDRDPKRVVFECNNATVNKYA